MERILEYTEKEKELLKGLPKMAEKIYRRLKDKFEYHKQVVYDKQSEMERFFNRTRQTISTNIRLLAERGLIEILKFRQYNNYNLPFSQTQVITPEPIDDLSEFENNDIKDIDMTVRKKFSELEQGEKVLLFQKLKEGLSSNNPQLKANLANALDRYISELRVTPVEQKDKVGMDIQGDAKEAIKEKRMERLEKFSKSLAKKYVDTIEEYHLNGMSETKERIEKYMRFLKLDF